jgi:hypothetical protein
LPKILNFQYIFFKLHKHLKFSRTSLSKQAQNHFTLPTNYNNTLKQDQFKQITKNIPIARPRKIRPISKIHLPGAAPLNSQKIIQKHRKNSPNNRTCCKDNTRTNN